MRFDETELGYKRTEDTTSQALFDFSYNDSVERESETNDIHTDTQQQSDDRSRKMEYTRTEPIQTLSRSLAQGKMVDSDEEPLYEHDERVSKRIVEALNSDIEKQASDESTRKIIRNPYGRKGKPKDKVELNLTQIREPQNLEEAFSSPQSDEWLRAVEEELSNLRTTKHLENRRITSG